MNTAPATGVTSSGAGVAGTGVTSTPGTGATATGENTSTSTDANQSVTSALGMNSGGTAGTQNPTSSMADMQTLPALQNASGEQFNTLFVSQMLQMHEAKVTELETALARITDPILKSVIARALPIIRMHRDLLVRANGRTGSIGQ